MVINGLLEKIQQGLFWAFIASMPVTLFSWAITGDFLVFKWVSILFIVYMLYAGIVRKQFSTARKLANNIALLSTKVKYNTLANPVSRWYLFIQARDAFLLFPSVSNGVWLVNMFDQADTNFAIVRNSAGDEYAEGIALREEIQKLRNYLYKKAKLPIFLHTPH